MPPMIMYIWLTIHSYPMKPARTLLEAPRCVLAIVTSIWRNS